jgi:hypothetical protein
MKINPTSNINFNGFFKFPKKNAQEKHIIKLEVNNRKHWIQTDDTKGRAFLVCLNEEDEAVKAEIIKQGLAKADEIEIKKLSTELNTAEHVGVQEGDMLWCEWERAEKEKADVFKPRHLNCYMC